MKWVNSKGYDQWLIDMSRMMEGESLRREVSL